MLEGQCISKPGNVDRCHDYPDTRLEHFLASIILPTGTPEGRGGFSRIGEIIYRQSISQCPFREIRISGVYSPGSINNGWRISGATRVVHETTVDDAVDFYRAFGRRKSVSSPGDELDVNDPGIMRESNRDAGDEPHDVMLHSGLQTFYSRQNG